MRLYEVLAYRLCLFPLISSTRRSSGQHEREEAIGCRELLSSLSRCSSLHLSAWSCTPTLLHFLVIKVLTSQHSVLDLYLNANCSRLKSSTDFSRQSFLTAPWGVDGLALCSQTRCCVAESVALHLTHWTWYQSLNFLPWPPTHSLASIRDAVNVHWRNGWGLATL